MLLVFITIEGDFFTKLNWKLHGLMMAHIKLGSKLITSKLSANKYPQIPIKEVVTHLHQARNKVLGTIISKHSTTLLLTQYLWHIFPTLITSWVLLQPPIQNPPNIMWPLLMVINDNPHGSRLDNLIASQDHSPHMEESENLRVIITLIRAPVLPHSPSILRKLLKHNFLNYITLAAKWVEASYNNYKIYVWLSGGREWWA